MIVRTTGGFSVRVGDFRLVAHDPIRPLVAAGLLLLAYVATSRHRFAEDLAWVQRVPDRHGSALALLIGAALATAGVTWSTYAASGADSYGYLSQADLWVRGTLVVPQRLAAVFGWAQVDAIFSPLGYRPGLAPHTIVPYYSPGLPMLMAVAALIAGPCGPHLVVPACAFALVWLTFALGRHLLSLRGALAAALLVATAPVTMFHTMLPMTDVPVAAAWTLALVLLMRDSVSRTTAAGVAAGAAILIRPNLAPLILVPVAALLLARGVPVQARLRRVVVFAPGVFAAAAFIAALNNHLYGSPFRSGYDALPDLFSWSNVPFNARLYAKRFAETATPAVLLALVPLFARVFRAPHGGVSPRLLLYGTTGILLALYLPYARFPEWTYLRFLLPMYPALYVALCAGGAWILDRGGTRVRSIVGAIAVVLLATFGIERSIALGAFGMQRYEGRYVAVGHWVGEHLPPNAIVLSHQHSGSIRYYAPRVTLRYDRIEDLRAVIGDLVRAGYHPYLLLENWERPEFTNRFLGVGFERLTWQPLARMTEPEPLALYDLLNRASEETPVEIPEVAPRCGRAAISTP